MTSPYHKSLVGQKSSFLIFPSHVGVVLLFLLVPILASAQQQPADEGVESNFGKIEGLRLSEEATFIEPPRKDSEKVHTNGSTEQASPLGGGLLAQTVPVAPQPVPVVPQPIPVAPRPVAPVTQPVDPNRPPPAIGSPLSPYAFKSYRLGYMQSDRVIALLKSLGYATVEFSAIRGESVNESIFTVIKQVDKYPLVVKIIDAAKTSLMQPAMDGGRSATGTNSLGGTYLHQQTTGAPEQRLLLVYQRAYPDQLHSLVELLRNEIDVPASQIVIEALVVEINTDKAKELGVQFTQVDKKTTTTLNSTGTLGSTFLSNEDSLFQWNGSTVTGSYLDYTGTTQYTYPGMVRTAPLGLSATISAYVKDGHAEVLSNPSILVLDGRQARIQVGRQVPNQSTLVQGTQSFASINYLL